VKTSTPCLSASAPSNFHHPSAQQHHRDAPAPHSHSAPPRSHKCSTPALRQQNTRTRRPCSSVIVAPSGPSTRLLRGEETTCTRSPASQDIGSRLQSRVETLLFPSLCAHHLTFGKRAFFLLFFCAQQHGGDGDGRGDRRGDDDGYWTRTTLLKQPTHDTSRHWTTRTSILLSHVH